MQWNVRSIDRSDWRFLRCSIIHSSTTRTSHYSSDPRTLSSSRIVSYPILSCKETRAPKMNKQTYNCNAHGVYSRWMDVTMSCYVMLSVTKQASKQNWAISNRSNIHPWSESCPIIPLVVDCSEVWHCIMCICTSCNAVPIDWFMDDEIKRSLQITTPISKRNNSYSAPCNEMSCVELNWNPIQWNEIMREDEIPRYPTIKNTKKFQIPLWFGVQPRNATHLIFL